MQVRGKLKFQEAGEALRKEVENELLAFAVELSGRINKNAPVGGNAHLRGSFAGEAIPIPNGVRVEIGSPLEYPAYVEFGTKPHWAPIEPIIQWVENKLQPHILAVGVNFDSGRALPNKSRKGTKQLKGDKRQRAIFALAHAVQYKIAMKGTQGQFFMRQALDSFGLGYNVDPSKGLYNIDIAGWLEPRMPAIVARATGRLA